MLLIWDFERGNSSIDLIQKISINESIGHSALINGEKACYTWYIALFICCDRSKLSKQKMSM